MRTRRSRKSRPARRQNSSGGGTNLVDLMKMGVETPDRLIDINRLPLAQIEELPDGKGVRIGALARNSDVAEHASDQSSVIPCSARRSLPAPVRSCAIWRRSAAIFCSARAAIIFTTRPFRSATSAIPAAAAARSKDSTASTPFSARANNASPRIRATCAWPWPRSTQSCACTDRKANAKFRSPISIVCPASTPNIDTNLQPDELITAVDLPALPFATRSYYLKMRDRASYAFALVSVAAMLELGAGRNDQSGPHRARRRGSQTVARDARRSRNLIGKTPDEKSFRDRRRSRTQRTRRVTSTTHSKSNWPSAASCARSATRQAFLSRT